MTGKSWEALKHPLLSFLLVGFFMQESADAGNDIPTDKVDKSTGESTSVRKSMERWLKKPVV